MKAITRKIDKLGRIVLPIDYRRALGLDIGSEVAFDIDGSTIKLKNAECKCRLCDSPIKKECTLGICRECIRRIKNF